MPKPPKIAKTTNMYLHLKVIFVTLSNKFWERNGLVWRPTNPYITYTVGPSLLFPSN